MVRKMLAVCLVLVLLGLQTALTVRHSAAQGSLFVPAPGSPFPTGDALSNTLAKGDFNGDGNLDVIVANFSLGGSISIMLGDGAGGLTLAPGSPFQPSSGTRIYGITAADLNNDGRLDAAALGGNQLFILSGNGAGQVSVSGTFPLPTCFFCLFLAPGDFNGDSRVDLAISNDALPGSVIVMLNQGGNVFAQAPGSPLSTGTPGSVWSLTVADLNADGRLDIITANETSNISVLLGNGAGGFSLGPGSPITTGINSPFAVAVADFNGDGIPDVVTSDDAAVGTAVAVLIGDGTGRLTPMPGSPFVTGGGPSFWVTAGDFNADGRADIATANTLANSSSVLLNTGSGFTSAPGSPFATSATEPRMVMVGDFNNDAKPDLALVHYQSHTVAILLNQFVPPTATPTNTPISTLTAIPAPPSATGSALQMPQGNIADPVIVKLSSLQLARPGENVLFTITNTNRGSLPATGIVVTDTVPNELEVVSASTSQGAFRINGSTLSFNVGTVNPAQVVTLTISTRVRPDVQPPVDVINTAFLDYKEGPRRSASATLHILRGILPATGEHPDKVSDTTSLWGLAILCALLVVLFMIHRRQ